MRTEGGVYVCTKDMRTGGGEYVCVHYAYAMRSGGGVYVCVHHAYRGVSICLYVHHAYRGRRYISVRTPCIQEDGNMFVRTTCV